ncbi:MAG: LamG domain-containing protein [Gammaproteobacteria bacterium]|nr:LamG domain-containing protein [Gammaproteobacteria bacterium]
MSIRPVEDSIESRDAIRDCEFDKFTKGIYGKRVVRTISQSLFQDSQILDLITNQGFLNDENGDPIQYSYYRVTSVNSTRLYANFYTDQGEDIFVVLMDFSPNQAAQGSLPLLYHIQKLDPFPVPFNIPIIETGYFLQGFSPAGLVVAHLNLTGGMGSPVFEVVSSSAGVFEIINNNRLVLGADYTDQDEQIEITIKATDGSNQTIEVTRSIVLGEPLPLTNLTISPDVVVDGLPSGRFVGKLSPVGGVGPYTYEILSDLDNKFELLNGNEIYTTDTMNILDVSYDLEVKVTDSLDSEPNVLVKTFTINIDPAITNTYALSFNGATQITKTPNTEFNPDTDDAFSISTWIKRLTAGTSDTVVTSLDTNNNNQGWIVYFDGNANNRLSVNLNFNASNQIRTRFTLGASTINSWHHLVVTYDGSGNANGINVYLDGVPALRVVQENGLGSNSIRNDDSFFYIGGRGNNSQNADMYIDQTAFFNKELSLSEVGTMYNGGVVEDIRLKELLDDMANAFEWEQNLNDSASNVLTIYDNQDLTSFTTDVP